MRKQYLFSIVVIFAIQCLSAQYICDFEDCSGNGGVSTCFTDGFCQTPPSYLPICSTDYAFNGIYSAKISNDGVVDAVLDLGNKIFGYWSLKFYMYIPSNEEGYFSLQGQVPIGSGEWIVGNIYFNKDNADAGHGFVDMNTVDTSDDILFDFPHNQWFQVVVNVDISTGINLSTWQFGIDGVDTTGGFVPFTDGEGNYPSALGGIDFFAIGSDNKYYLDAFTYQDIFFILSLEDSQTNSLLISPNPVNEVLYLRADENMTQVSIHNLLGQEVYNASFNTTQATVDMSQLHTGTYIVKVNIGDTIRKTRIIK